MSRRLCLAAAALGCIVLSTAPHAAAKRSITETDLFRFTWIADPQIAPDGTAVAFVDVVANENENRYESAIYSVPSAGGAEPQRLTAGNRDTSPRWSPDGKWLAFVRAPEKDGQPQPPQLYLMRTNGGEARALTDLPKGASSPVWSPDSRSLAFSSATLDDDLKKTEPPKDGHKSDVRVITRPVYRSNGNPTYVDPDRKSHIWIAELAEDGAGAAIRQVTKGEFDERGTQWSPDGSTLYFTSDRRPDAFYEPSDSDLYSVPARGGAITRISSIDGPISAVAPSPDGRRLAFVGTLVGSPIRSYSESDLWVVDARPDSPPVNLTTGYDFDIGGGIGGDQAAPRGEQPKPIVWAKDGSALIVSSSEHGSANLRRVLVPSGKVEPVTDGPQDVVAYTATPDATRIAATISTQTNIGDISIFRVGAGLASALRLTNVNETLFAGIAQSEPEEIWYTSFDGRRIQGWILKPPDFDPARTYPMILEIHGGPHSAYGNTYTHEFMWMAAKGYVVLFTNPRGSTSYGQEFGNLIQYKYPGDDYKDLMAGVDEVLTRGYVDAARLGVTGGSGGGLLTNWTITQTHRFKAAVAQRDIADWYGFWFTADFAQFQPTWFRKAPWEDPQDFAARSPITHVASVTTPLMLILGDQDYRTPPADGGEMMFRALKYRRIPTVMVRFPRESHELSRSGEPWHRVERLQHIVGWMDKWLQGKNSATYD